MKDIDIEDKFDSEENEITYTIEKRVLENDEKLKITFYTNDRINESDDYMLQINQKEKTLHS